MAGDCKCVVQLLSSLRALHAPQPASRARNWLKRLGGDDALFVTAVTRLAGQGIAIEDLAENDTERAAMSSRIHDYLDWNERTQGRALAQDVVGYWNAIRKNSNKAAG